MLQSIFKDKTGVDRSDDRLTTADLTAIPLVRMMFWEHLWPRKNLLVISLISMAVVGAATGLIPVLMKFTADELIVNRNRALLTIIPLSIIGVMTAKAIAEYVSTVTESYIGISISADLRKRVAKSLLSADLSWLQQNHSGRYVMSFMNDVNAVTDVATLSIISFAKNFLRAGFLIATMFYLDWKLALLAVAAIPIAMKFLSRHRGKMFTSAKKSMAETGDLGSLVTQALSGIRVVKAYDRADAEASRIGQVIDRANEFLMRAVRIRTASGPMTEALTGVGFAAAITVGGWRGMQGDMTLGEFMGFITAAMLIYQPIRQMATMQTALQTGVAAAQRVFGIIDHPHKVIDAQDAVAMRAEGGEIIFDNVSFSYDGIDQVLHEVSFTVPAGQKFALVGASGAGKSTVMNLLLRFYDPVGGKILIDGQDISACTMSSVRRTSALVTQEPFLFDDTVAANIAYGSEDASQEAIETAAKAAVAHDFVTALPKGYETEVGEAGTRLSGGQKQRIAIARAMLRDAPILLLDEPTSALDSQSEAQIQTALEHLISGKTVLMIAHRLSTVRHADRILVLDKGRIVEQGTHAQLLKKKGAYARLHAAQIDTGETKTKPRKSGAPRKSSAAKPRARAKKAVRG